ncbi:MAG: FtsX-like permease family protein, partial [Candidatus Odinarchaeota archaeon]
MIRRKALIVLWLSRSNLKLLMVSLTGLVIALSMLAGCMYYVEFARGDIYLSNFEDIEEEMDVVNFHYSVEPELEGITSIKNFLDNKIRELQLETLLKPVELSPVCYHSSLEASGYYGDSNFFHDYVSGFYGLNETILAECIPGSRFPANTSEILVYTPEAGIFDINSEFNLTVYRSRGNENHTVTITAIITDSTMKNGSIYQKLLTGKDFSYDYYDYLGYPGNEIRFFFPLDLYLQLLEELNLQRDRYFQIGFTYDIDLSGINQATVIAAVENFFVLEKAVYLRVYGEREYDYYDYYGYYYFNSDISWRLYESIFLVNSFIFIFAMLSIPVIVLAIVLVYFSLGILNDKRKKTVEMVKASGISGRFIFLSLFTELVILALAATAISMVVGIPLAFFTGTTSGFLSFTRPIDLGSYVLIIRPSTLQVLLVLGLILTFLTHFPAAIKLSRARVTRLESDTRQKRKRRRLRLPTGKTDILLLLAGFGGLFLFSFFNNLIWLLGPAAMSIYYIFMPFLLVLVILSPVFIVIGGVMIFNRIFMLFIPLMGKITWRRDWRLVATAFRQLNVNAKFAARTSLVLALGISFLIVIVVLPSSVMNYGEDSRYYSQGADIRIQLGDASEEETNGVMLALRNVTGLKSTSTIQMRVGTEVTQQDGDYDRYHYYARIYFLGIQQDFHEVAHWQSYYDDESLEDLVSSLYNSPELVPAIVDSNTVSVLEMINPLSVDLSYYNPVTS